MKRHIPVLFAGLLVAAGLAACAAPASSTAKETAGAGAQDTSAPHTSSSSSAGSVSPAASTTSVAAAPSDTSDTSKTTAAAPRTQETVAYDFIYHLLTGNRDSVALLFEEEARTHVTQEVVDYFQGQFKWLYNFIGGDFEEFLAGRADSVSYFREYRMSNETNKRYPLILVHVVFPDSITPVLIGAQVKSFLGGKEKRVANDQVWTIDDREFDLHSIIAVETGEGNLMAIQFYDDDISEFTQEAVALRGIPLIREAVARGYLDSARAVLDPGQTLQENVGVVFIRKDKRLGLTHHKIAFSPAEYAVKGPEAPKPAKPDAGKKPAAQKTPSK